MNQDEAVIAQFIDPSNLFDTVQDERLLRKLENIGKTNKQSTVVTSEFLSEKYIRMLVEETSILMPSGIGNYNLRKRMKSHNNSNKEDFGG